MDNSYNTSFLLICFTVLLISSCAPKIPFTQMIREDYKLSEQELNALQFYTSHDILLKRGEVDENEKVTDAGKLTVKSGKSLEQVIIRAGTPGVVEKVADGNRIIIRFEDGNSNYLVFGNLHRDKGAYRLQTIKKSGERNVVNYGDKLYYASKGSENIFLTFRLKNLHSYRKKQKVVKGMKLKP